MNKKIILIIAFIIVFICIPKNVYAKESLGTCVYNIDTERLMMDNLVENLRLEVTVYDDGSTGNRKFKGRATDGTQINIEPGSSRYLLEDQQQITISYQRMFDRNGLFYQGFEERNNCPNMQFNYKYASTTPNLTFFVGGNHAVSQDEATIVVSANIQGGNNSQPSETITYCTLRNTLNIDQNREIEFTTTSTNGLKEYKIKMGNDEGVAAYNSTLSIAGHTFKVREEDYDVYWSSSCNSSTPFRLSADPTYGSLITIQTSEPARHQNAASRAEEWEELGAEVTINDFNQEIGCDHIFEKEPGQLGWLLDKILGYIKVIGPILVVILSAIDFTKAIFGTDEKAMKEAQSKLIIRLVCAVCLFLAPTLVQVLLSFVDQTICTLQ